ESKKSDASHRGGADYGRNAHVISPTALFTPSLASEPRRILHLIEPIEAHLLDDAIAHHDQPRVLGGEVLMGRERGDINVIAALPFELARLLRPLPFEGVETVEFHVPMQIIA